MKHKNSNTKERGQSLIELSMSLVMLLTLLAGVVDFGRAFFTWITLLDAAQEGASYASVIPTTYLQADEINSEGGFCDEIIDRVKITTKDLSGGVTSTTIDLSEMDISVDIFLNGKDCGSATPADICYGKEVMVQVNYDSFPITMPFLGTILGSQQIPLRASVRDTILTPACSCNCE